MSPVDAVPSSSPREVAEMDRRIFMHEPMGLARRSLMDMDQRLVYQLIYPSFDATREGVVVERA